MESEAFGFKVTTHGRNILAACMGQEKALKLTRAAVGSGDAPDGINLADVHELVSYVAEGKIGERRHEADRLYLTIQYVNDADNEDVPTFILSEFIIYAINPVTGEEQDFIYAALRDYRASIPAYRTGFAPGIWNFPITTVVSDEINVTVTVPAGLVTYSEMINLFNTRAAGAAQRDITIPASGWVEDTDSNSAYPFYLDIASMEITEDMIPLVDPYPESMKTAAGCGLCQTSQTLPNLLRLYAESVPSAVMRASLTLLDTAPQESGLSGSAVAERLDMIIPADGWVEDEGDVYAVHTDIPNTAVKPELIPMLTIFPEHLELAGKCGLSRSARTMTDMLRVYACNPPEAPISVSLALLGVTQSITGSIQSDSNAGNGVE